MANSDKNIVITPNIGQVATPAIVFTGGSNTPGTLTVNDAGTLTFDKQFISSVATGTAPFAVSSTTRVANLNVATAGTADNAVTFDSASSLTRTASHRANRNITGGGTLSVDASNNVKWTSRFIVISNGRGTYFSTAGYFDIDMPASGTITGVGGAANVTVTAAGIPLSSWQALYYILPIGSNNASVAANFRIASYTADADIPHTWLLICVRNGDSGVCYFNNGIALKNSESINVATHDARRSIISDTLTTARTIGGVSFDGSANINLPGVNTTGNQNTSGSARFVSSPDGDRNAGTKLPTTNPNAVRYDFVGSGSTGTGGTYAGVMTYAPWAGTTASTGDASYQLAFGSTATNGSGRPQLNIRNGIDSTWNAWYTLIHSGNTERATWSTFGRSIGLVAGELAWKHYGNSHTIFDASNGTSPAGGVVNNTNAATAWSATLPTLMGWNGSSTYGVRVDSARVADSATDATKLPLAGGSMTGLLIGRLSVGTNVNTMNDTGSFSIRSDSANAASISFHRTGAFAINMGVGTDNIFRIGGWSASANCFQMTSGGALTMLGDVTAFSDIRLKDNIKPISNALTKILNIRGVTFTRTDQEDQERVHIGVIAQEIEEYFPEVVLKDTSGIKSVNYGAMAGAFIEAIKELQIQITKQAEMINELKAGALNGKQ